MTTRGTRCALLAVLLGACAELDPYSVRTCRIDADCLDPLVCFNRRCRQPDGTERYGTRWRFSDAIDVGWWPVGLVLEDLSGDGHVDVAVANVDGELFVSLGDGRGGLGPPARHRITEAPGGLGARDLDGDGAPELVAFSESMDPPVSVFPNLGEGRFGPPLEMLPGLQMRGDLDFGDFDEDGVLDVVVGGRGRWLLATGKGDGSLDAAGLFGNGRDSSRGLRTLHLPGSADAHLDVAMLNAETFELELYAGRGDGSFEEPPDRYDLGTRDGWGRLAVADLDGDGSDEIVVGAQQGVVLLDAEPGGVLESTQLRLPVPDAFAIQVVDLEPDGDLDLLVGSRGPSHFSLLVNAGDASFTAYSSEGLLVDVPDDGPRPYFVRAADLDGDHRLDLVVTGPGASGADRVTVFLAE